MRIDVLTLFPEMFPEVLGASIIGRAVNKGILGVGVHNIRDYSDNKQRQADDYPFGGGAGMVMMAQPILDCLDAIEGNERARRIYLSPRGKKLSASVAGELAKEEHLILLAGHYEGVDERALTRFDEQISIGDYVLTGGELAAMVLIDCVIRLVPGVLGNEDSAVQESFASGLLEYPQYTRPAEFCGMGVPEVLLSGHHANIERWRRERSLELTLSLRPDLLENAELSEKDKQFLKTLEG